MGNEKLLRYRYVSYGKKKLNNSVTARNNQWKEHTMFVILESE